MKRSALKLADLYPTDPALDIPAFTPRSAPRVAGATDAAVASPVHDAHLELALAFPGETDKPYPPLVKAALLVGAPLAFWTAVAVAVARVLKVG